ncbi:MULTISPECIES: helix-turn-helix domain-containing protein [Herpetosiphon]|uniref:helix-turn-helix domain-containing protein n=1 Tax=Herpetosiphon TaxID=64 RepID=UPI00136490CA|nr:helix-turn-helix transcriptional regulator [Herpetosiphon geysericola]
MLGLSSLLSQELASRNWSLRELATRSGIAVSTLSNLINKPDVMPDLRTLNALAISLNLPIRQLVEACGIPVDAHPSDEDATIQALITAVPEVRMFLNLLGQLSPDDRAAILSHLRWKVETSTNA